MTNMTSSYLAALAAASVNPTYIPFCYMGGVRGYGMRAVDEEQNVNAMHGTHDGVTT